MKTKNRRPGGGGAFRKTLQRHIESCPEKNLPADELVSYLRSEFKQYERTKVRELARHVQSILEESRSKKLIENDGGASDSSAVTHKIEEEEDSIFEEEFEPKVDLMKSLLRSRYNGGDTCVKRKRIELKDDDDEVVELKKKKKKKVVRKSMEVEENVSGKGGPMFRDLGGMEVVVEELMKKVIRPFRHPELVLHLGGRVRTVTGILLHGPPGCGKTTLARAIANETGLRMYMTSATELVTGVSGASEENIRELFSKARKTGPSIVFIDEIDAIASKRENQQREMEKRMATQLMTCMDESHHPDVGDSEDSNARPGYVLVIGATNRPDAIDPALRRPGRFDREIVLGVPDESARGQILSVLTHKLKIESDLDLLKIARATPGFVGADLAALTEGALNLALNRILDQAEISRSNGDPNQVWELLPEELAKSSITMADFEVAARDIQPSSKREGFSDIPDVKWDDIGGLHQLREELDYHIIRRIKFPEDYEDFDLETGFLLYGPPGCGKTLIAQAVANEAGANFMYIQAAELLNKYVGESELAVRTLFSRARTCSPCIIFFDEVDALTTNCERDGGWVVERLLKQLLIELDGAKHRKGVYVIGATNSPHVMHKAILRPGRFGEHLYVPVPSAEERGLILKTLARKKPIDSGVDLMEIGKDLCKNFNGADLSKLMNTAFSIADKDHKSSGRSIPRVIKHEHFIQALQKVPASTSDEQIRYYDRLSKSFKAV